MKQSWFRRLTNNVLSYADALIWMAIFVGIGVLIGHYVWQ